MKNVFVVVSFLMVCVFLNAQKECGTTAYYKKQLKEKPSIADSAKLLEQRIKSYTDSHSVQ